MKRRISETARRLFQTEGYATVSMRRIASELGCAPMTLYKYYDAKIDILRSLWADVFAELFAELDDLSIADQPPRERLIAQSTAYVEFWLRRREAYRLVFMAEGVTQPDVSVFLDNPEIVARYDVFASAISAACSDKLKADALKLRLEVLICALHGIAHNAITISGYPWSDPKAILAIIVDGIVGGESRSAADLSGGR